MSTTSEYTASALRLSAPPSWPAALTAASAVPASMMSMTASASVRSSLPFRKARFVNSPGPGRPGPGGEESLQRGAQHDGGAVTLELCGVLAGVAVRRAAYCAQAEVQDAPARVEQAAVDEEPVRVRGHGPAVGGAEHSVSRGQRSRPGDADYAYSRNCAAGSYGGYGV